MSDSIKAGKYVSLTYTITDESGTILESIDLPINFIQGRDSEIIEKVSQALEGHSVGDVVSVALSPAEGFGEHQPELTFTDDVDNVPAQFHNIGAEVEFQNDHGETRVFRVTHIEDGKLTVDGNHPFAGKKITYNISVESVRDATPEELANSAQNAPRLH
ncbi:MAG: FKBP-type peptidyl-prolyl cis-trans isomerase [Gammaproteobacteria bacterium]